jgi:hypothetical protein
MSTYHAVPTQMAKLRVENWAKKLLVYILLDITLLSGSYPKAQAGIIKPQDSQQI